MSQLLFMSSMTAEKVRTAIEKGANPNTQRLNDGNSPLHITDNPEVAKALLDGGANPRLKNFSEQTPLHLATLAGRTSVIRAIASSNRETLDDEDYVGRTALELAVSNNQTESAKALIELGADVNAPFGPLVSSHNNTDLVKLFLEAGAEPNSRTTEGNTLLHLSNNPEVAQILLDAGASVDARNNAGKTPLMMLFMDDLSSNEIAKLLIDRGADVLATDIKGNAPSHPLAKERRKQLLEKEALTKEVAKEPSPFERPRMDTDRSRTQRF